MKRPMFKMGGKANSQGTGITSGLDEKVNMAIGGGVIKGQNMGAREGFQNPRLSSILNQMGDMDASALNRFLAERMGSGTGMSDMKDIIKLQALGNLATNVLPNIESGGFTAVTDFLKDPMTTQTAVKGLTGLKQVDLKQKQLEDTALANFVKNQIDIQDKERSAKIAKDAFDLKVKIAEDDKAYKQGVLNLKEKQLAKTSESNTIKNYNAAKTLLDKTSLSEEKKMDILLGVLTRGSYQTVSSQSAAIRRALLPSIADGIISADMVDQLIENFENTNLSIFNEGNAMGGTPNRVDRAMGTPMMGEQPMNQDMGMAQTTKQDVAMETKGQGNNVYAMLRARLPQEISDEVVKLIAYNKEAFADFASIKNQEDVSSFNEKYGVQLVIDVATV
jgi:hypothetical protein